MKFEAGKNYLLRGDARDGLRAVIKGIQQRSIPQIKMIYIDPPYNTGNTFAYTDRRDSEDWVAMMRSRLALAREVLREDGLIFISIDINELTELKGICDEIFGPENFVANFVWVSNLKGRQLGFGPAGTHEYILTYARDAKLIGKLRGSVTELTRLMPEVYRLPKREIKHDFRGEYVTKNELYNTNSKFNEVTSPSMVFAIHYCTATGEIAVTDVGAPAPGPASAGWVTALPHPNAKPGLKWHAWRWSRARVMVDHEELEFDVKGRGKNRRLRIWTKVRDFDTTTLKDLIMGPSTVTGLRELERLGLGGIFETPKPVELLKVLIKAASEPGDLVMDFFAGSGSFGVAAAETGRQFILVQLEELFEETKSGFSAQSDDDAPQSNKTEAPDFALSGYGSTLPSSRRPDESLSSLQIQSLTSRLPESATSRSIESTKLPSPEPPTPPTTESTTTRTPLNPANPRTTRAHALGLYTIADLTAERLIRSGIHFQIHVLPGL